MRESINKPESKKILVILLSLVAVVALGGTSFFYFKYQQAKKDPNIAGKQEISTLQSKVGKLIQLPKDEDPTVATVTDKNKLKDQDFFKEAKNGDKLLAYVKAKEAILYRPSSDQIVKVAPIYISSQDTDSTKKDN